MVHIDLGIAFEQGHLLATPERVPFRLTRDVVDGFGISGAPCRSAGSRALQRSAQGCCVADGTN